VARSRIVNIENLQQFTAINLLSDPGHLGGPLVIPNCIQIEMVWGLSDAKQGHNVMYGFRTDGVSPTQAQATAILVSLTGGAQWAALAAFLATSSQLGALTLRDVRTPNQPIIQNTTGGALGTSASPELPNETSVVVTLRTALTGIANRGRIYIPGWATNALGAGNVVAATAVTALGNWANTIPAAFTAQGYTMVLGHPARGAYTGSTGTAHPARPAGSVPITSLVVRDNHWDSQRRRGLK
jgi:hypothetical protein